jgi:streptomycin 6-kinase
MHEPGFVPPEPFRSTVLLLHGVAGAAWLRELPQRLNEVAKAWVLTLGAPEWPLSYNYVTAAARADGTPVVLKMRFPGDPELLPEIAALRLFNGTGSARLLACDEGRGALLLERVRPGGMLSRLTDRGKDEAATAAAAAVMRRLWRPVPDQHPFPTTADWSRGFKRMRQRFDGGTGPLPREIMDRADALWSELESSAPERVLLHGDLHHFNILESKRDGWLAIDPKGLVGDPAFEAGALLRNPFPALLTLPHPQRTLDRRIDQLSEELGLDRTRIRGWAFAQAALSAWWTIEDNQSDVAYDTTCAHLLQPGT